MSLPSPKVSIVIPTCDRAEMLRCAISSVLAQTWQDFELLVVDDASKDHTAGVVASFSDPRIVYLKQEQRIGGAAARNRGIDCARGEVVAFLDDDDEWLPMKLEKQMVLFERRPISLGLVYTGYWIIDKESGKVVQQKIPTKQGDLSREIFIRNWVGGSSSVAVRKSCLLAVHGFDPSLPSFQDYDLWIRMAKKFEFDFVKEPLLKYHLHQQKIWTNPDALIRGLDLMLKKHGQSASLKRNLANYYLSLGAGFCRQGEAGKGRRSLGRAILLNPFEARNYFYFLLSMLGANWFVTVHQGMDTLLRPLRPKKDPSIKKRQ